MRIPRPVLLKSGIVGETGTEDRTKKLFVHVVDNVGYHLAEIDTDLATLTIFGKALRFCLQSSSGSSITRAVSLYEGKLITMANKKLADQINQAAANFANEMMKGEVTRAQVVRDFEDFKWQAERAAPGGWHSLEWWGVEDKIKKLDRLRKKAEKSGKREDWVNCFQVVLELAGAMASYERMKAKKLKLDLKGWNQKEWEEGKRPALMKCGADGDTRKKFSALDTGRAFLKTSGVPQEYIDSLISGEPAEKMPKLDKQAALSLCKQQQKPIVPSLTSVGGRLQSDLVNALKQFVKKMVKSGGLSKADLEAFKKFQKAAKSATSAAYNSHEWDNVMAEIEKFDRQRQFAEEHTGNKVLSNSDRWTMSFMVLVRLVDAMDRYRTAKEKEPGDGRLDDDTQKKLDVIQAGEKFCASLGVPTNFTAAYGFYVSDSSLAEGPAAGAKPTRRLNGVFYPVRFKLRKMPVWAQSSRLLKSPHSALNSRESGLVGT